MRKLLSRLFPVQEVGDGRGNVFFDRYTILKTDLFGLLESYRAVYIHRFYRSDNERCLHDHPWDFIAVILWGGYWEEMRDFSKPVASVYDRETKEYLGEVLPRRKHWRGPGSILFRPAETAHRIELDPARPKPISLVYVGPKLRSWGFWTVAGWKAWVKGDPNPVCDTK